MNVLPVKPRSWETVEKQAHNFLATYQPEALQSPRPINVEKLFDIYIPDFMSSRFGINGFQTGYERLRKYGDGIEGYTSASDKLSYVETTLYDFADTPTERRFRATVAHEMYHCIEHVPQFHDFSSYQGNDPSKFYRASAKIPAYRNPEKQAWVFGNALLMPRVILLPLLQEGKNNDELAEIFNVNPALVRARLGCKTLKS